MKKWLFVVSLVSLLGAALAWIEIHNTQEALANKEPLLTTPANEPRTPPDNKVSEDDSSDLPPPPPESIKVLLEPNPDFDHLCVYPDFPNQEQIADQLSNMILNNEDVEAIYALLQHLKESPIVGSVDAEVWKKRDKAKKEQLKSARLSSIVQDLKNVKNGNDLLEIIEAIPVKDRPLVSSNLLRLADKISLSEQQFDRLMDSGIVTDLHTLAHISYLALTTPFNNRLEKKIIKKIENLPARSHNSFDDSDYAYIFLARYQNAEIVELFLHKGANTDFVPKKSHIADFAIQFATSNEIQNASNKTISTSQEQKIIFLKWLSENNIFPSILTIIHLQNNAKNIPEWITQDYLPEVIELKKLNTQSLYSSSILRVADKIGVKLDDIYGFNESLESFDECTENYKNTLDEIKLDKKLAKQDFIAWLNEQKPHYSDKRIEEALSKISTRYIHFKRIYSRPTSVKAPIDPDLRKRFGAYSTYIEDLENAALSGEVSAIEINQMIPRRLISRSIKKHDIDSLDRLFYLGLEVDRVRRPLADALKKSTFSDFELLDYFHSKGLSFDYRYPSFTPFLTAIKNDNLELAKYIRDKGATLGAEHFLEDALSHTLQNYTHEKKDTLEYLLSIEFPIYKQHRRLHAEAKKTFPNLANLPK
ncbi:hypothetical protein KFE80_10365 [bacterium SCSIO 12696]|nr:hypothetical protein KFE80_10365 [bacterium SCSIO 12696]